MSGNFNQSICYNVAYALTTVYCSFFERKTERDIDPNDLVFFHAMNKINIAMKERKYNHAFRWNADIDHGLGIITASEYLEYMLANIYPWVMMIAIKYEKRLLDLGHPANVNGLYGAFAEILRIPYKLCWLRDEIARRDQERLDQFHRELAQLEASMVVGFVRSKRTMGEV